MNVCVEKSHQKLVASLACRPGWLQIRSSLHHCSRRHTVVFHVDLLTLVSAALSPLQRDTKTRFNLHSFVNVGTTAFCDSLIMLSFVLALNFFFLACHSPSLHLHIMYPAPVSPFSSPPQSPPLSCLLFFSSPLMSYLL